MVLLDELKDKVRPDIRSQKVEELEKAAVMADDYALTHKMNSKPGTLFGTMVQVIEKIYPKMIDRDKVNLLRM